MSGKAMDGEENNPVPVPLPTEVPPPPDFSALPAHILHSGTVETLIGQNEDLMARLKVNIRRNSILEQQIMENERINGELARINSSLNSQLQILQEKDRMWREKNARIDSKHEALIEEISLLKTRLVASDERKTELSENLKRHTAYRRRIQKWVRPLLSQIHELLSSTELQLAARDAEVSDLRARLSEAVQHAQTLQRQTTKDQSRLVEQYEERQRRLEADLEKARSEIKHLGEKANRLDDAIQRKADAENRAIHLERRIEEMETSFRAELGEFQNQAARYRSEAKVLAVETLEYDRKLKETSTELEELRSSNARLQDQLESLQTVWADTQKRLEASKLQQESLNRLNQELSRQLKEQRKTQQERSTEAPQAEPQVISKQIEKIDHLLVRLESGFSDSRSQESAQIKNLDFEEKGTQPEA